MKILDSFLEKVGTDKALHFLGGGFICSLITFVVILQEPLVSWEKVSAVTIGALFVLIISILKEVLLDDKPDWKDVWAAMLGSLLVYLAVALGVWFEFLMN